MMCDLCDGSMDYPQSEKVDVEALEAKWRHHLANGSHEAHDIVGLLDKYHALQAELEAAREREKALREVVEGLACTLVGGTGERIVRLKARAAALVKLDAGEEG